MLRTWRTPLRKAWKDTFERDERLLLGRIVKQQSVGVEEHVCAQVRIRRNVFNDHLKMFFGEPHDLWAVDGERAGKLGDMVLIRQRASPLTPKVTHDVERVVYEFGRVVDPVTKRRVVGDDFSERESFRTDLINRALGLPEGVPLSDLEPPPDEDPAALISASPSKKPPT